MKLKRKGNLKCFSVSIMFEKWKEAVCPTPVADFSAF